MDQPTQQELNNRPVVNVKIIKLVSGEDVVTMLPPPDKQLPPGSHLMRIEKPLLIKYVPQMTMTGFKDYIALIKWCSYTPDKIITIPKNKIMTITNASTEMMASYGIIAKNYYKQPTPLRQEKYKQTKFTDAENEKISEIFDDFDDDEGNTTLH